MMTIVATVPVKEELQFTCTYFVEIDGLPRQNHTTALPSMHHLSTQQGQKVRLRVVANAKVRMEFCVHVMVCFTPVTREAWFTSATNFSFLGTKRYM